jgi:hypothetical protein
VRHFFTSDEAAQRGVTRSQLRWGESTGRWRSAGFGVYAEGPDPLSRLDEALAIVVATDGVAGGSLAGVLLRLDSVVFQGPDVSVPPGRSSWRRAIRRRRLDPARVTCVGQFTCTDGAQTLLDLALTLDDDRWEQALESALRKRLASVDEIALACRGTRGCDRVRRVLARRPAGAPPTESLLETLMVQLARVIPGLPPPIRQYTVYDEHGQVVARVDLAWPELGLFIELDGQHHIGQPVYDASRETAVVAATGWLCGRFTWDEIVRRPRTTGRRLAKLVDQARRRPLAGG